MEDFHHLFVPPINFDHSHLEDQLSIPRRGGESSLYNSKFQGDANVALSNLSFSQKPSTMAGGSSASSAPSFPPFALDTELCNLMMNAHEKELPLDLTLPRRTTGDKNDVALPKVEMPKIGRGAKATHSNRKRKFISVPLNEQSDECPDDSLPEKASKVKPSELPLDEVDGQDEEQIKRNRRLVKNREAAQQFRQRQKAYIQDLEQKVSTLTSDNANFQNKLDLLNAENKLIKEQLSYLRNFITQLMWTPSSNPTGSVPVGNVPSNISPVQNHNMMGNHNPTFSHNSAQGYQVPNASKSFMKSNQNPNHFIPF